MFCLCRLYWFHQWRIPHRMCRFYCSLRGHQRTEKRNSEEPLSSILWTPPPHPGTTLAWFTACGGDITADREGYSNIVCANRVSWCRLHFRIFCLACVFRFSFVLMEDRRCLCGWNRSLRITADREGLFQCCFACIRVLLND